MNTQKQVFLIVVLFFMLVGGCAAYTAIDMTVRAPNQREFHYDESITRGALLFANNCRTCHGARGEGGVGLPLNTDAFKNQDPLVLKANRDKLRRTISCGRAGTLMPTWLNTNGGSLNAVQIEHIVDLITQPLTPGLMDENESPTSKGWLEAYEFSKNLNHEVSVIVGGDTLDSIAISHNVGANELARANNLRPADPVAKGAKLQVPPSKQFPNGYTYTVDKDAQTVQKVADALHVGAIIIGDLNNIETRLDRTTGRLTLFEGGREVTGLLAGQQLSLPDGATYNVTEGDTRQSVSRQHNVGQSAIENLNGRVAGLPADEPLPSKNSIELPAGAVYIVQPGQTYAQIAALHELTVDELAREAGINASSTPTPGQRLRLPASTRYVVTAGERLESIAATHGVTVDALVRSNPGLDPNQPLSTKVVLRLPSGVRYVVESQTLAELADTLSNVTAESLAAANNLQVDQPLRVGSTLVLPEDAWGSAPPDAVNPGIGCTQFTLNESAYNDLVNPVPAPTRPPTPSSQVTIEANANDWTVVADGQRQTPNRGAVLVASGSQVQFRSVVGLHTVTVNETKDNGDLRQGDQRALTFAQSSSTFVITCDFHPAMKAWVFTQ